MKRLAATDEGLRTAASLIRSGRLVAFGTETVYGLGADATNEAAVAGIFEAKQRPTFDPLIVHLSDSREIDVVASEWPAEARKLSSAFWPGPLTIVVPKKPVVPDLVTSGLPEVAVRVPGNAVARRLIEMAGCPVAAPSANPFGMTSPTTAEHVISQLTGRIDAVLDTGPCCVGVESTVVRVEDGDCVILRPGGVTAEELASVLPRVRPAADREKGELRGPHSPGRLPSHYSPGVPVIPVASGIATTDTGLLAFGRTGADWPGPVERLSQSGDPAEAAANLFAAMRRLRDAGVRRIAFDPVPMRGLGVAINDRLRRAAAAASDGHGSV